MLRVTAEGEAAGSKPPRHVGADIVAVLDISGSMLGDKLERMKKAMTNVIDKLGTNDRLSIVSFESNVYRLTELTYMSEQGRRAARDKMNELFTKGGTNMGPALHEGAQILRGRRAEEMSNRVGCIVFLSDGLDSGIFEATISPDFPAHTFGLGEDHDPKAMKLIADKTSGTYSYVNNDTKRINYAFQLFIAGITSVSAKSVEVTLGTPDGILISSIESGGYSNKTTPDRRSGTISIDNMYAGDRKNFIVFLELAAMKQAGKQKVLTVSGQYQGVSAASKKLAGVDVSVMRPLKEFADRLVKDPDVAQEAARIKLLRLIDSASQQESPNLAKAWSRFETSCEVDDAPQAVQAFQGDYDKMIIGIDDPQAHKKLGLPYMLSWLSSHKWQRATTMDDPSHTPFISTAQQVINKASATGDPITGVAPTSRWEKDGKEV
ncbi:hypothetical protein ZWY2020_051759 [Hordeum vulgare]|nr:hypothetical protein ZWY2020_051759 [Hordeum vulgare]